MRGTPVIRIADTRTLLYEGELFKDCELPVVIQDKLKVNEDHMFSIYFREGGNLAFMAVMRSLFEGRVTVKMSFHQGRPEHICDAKDVVAHLLHLVKYHVDDKQLG